MPETQSQTGGSLRRGKLPAAVVNALGILPLTPLGIASEALMRSALAWQPEMFRRLDEHARKRFAIDPVDCPFVFVLEPDPDRPRLRIVRSLTGVDCDARIAGTLLVLMGLIDGAYDGDALFFSRDVLIEGDTEAVLSLRNAIENAEIGPTGSSGQLLSPVAAGLRFATSILRKLLEAPAETFPSELRI